MAEEDCAHYVTSGMKSNEMSERICVCNAIKKTNADVRLPIGSNKVGIMPREQVTGDLFLQTIMRKIITVVSNLAR